MAGVFDLHTLIALESGWNSIKSDSDAFDLLFEGIETSVVTSWRTELLKTDIEFAAAFSPGETKLPAVFTKLEEDAAEIQPLGFHIGESSAAVSSGTAKRIMGFEARETASIYVFATNTEILRAIYVLVRGLMVSSVPWLVEHAGYTSIEFGGGGDLEPEQGLWPEDLGAFVRVQRWNATSVARISTVDLSHTDFVIQATDIAVDSDNYGGVDGQETI
jgi:hypothetical protein